MLVVALMLPIQNNAKKLKYDWNPGTWVLIWEYSARAIQWIPTWKGLDGFQKSLCPCVLGKSSLSIGRVNPTLSLEISTNKNTLYRQILFKYL